MMFLAGLFMGIILTAFVEHCDRAKAGLGHIDLDTLQAGGNCGCCGKWVADAVVERDWPWTLCEECAKPATCTLEYADGQVVKVEVHKP